MCPKIRIKTLKNEISVLTSSEMGVKRPQSAKCLFINYFISIIIILDLDIFKKQILFSKPCF